MIASTATRTLTVKSPVIPEKNGVPILTPVRLSGDEDVSALFTYSLLLKTPEVVPGSPATDGPDIDLAGLVGRELTLFIELDGQGHFESGSVGRGGSANQGAGTREISALITEAAYLYPEGRHHVYSLTLRPWLHLATLTTDHKIYQDKTVIELLDGLLSDYPFPVDKRLESGKYPPRDYQTQYGETDYDFFARLCEEWGIAWWFEHSSGTHRLILADQPGAW